MRIKRDMWLFPGKLKNCVFPISFCRRKKKQEIVENFKRLYPGVFDRLINMSQPIHKKYNVAITKQLGRYMEAIVVDCEATARQCIQYLKDQMLEPETFLPLDYIQTKPLKERLRNINHPKGVKLLYDVLRSVAHLFVFPATTTA